MTTSIGQIRQRIAEIQATVPGVKRAYERAPQSLADTDLPAFCTFTGPASIMMISETLVEETRTWLMRLYVSPILTGIDGEAEKKAEEFLIQVRNIFLSHPMLGKGIKDSVLSFVEKVVWMGDNGLQVLPYAGQNYLGVEFRIGISMMIPILIATYE